MTKMLIVVVFSIVCVTQQALPRKTPIAFPLTAEQRTEWNQFGAAEQQLQKNLQELVSRVVTVPTNCQNSMEFHSALKDTVQQMQIIGAKRDAWLSDKRSEKGCKGCVVEGGALIEPRP